MEASYFRKRPKYEKADDYSITSDLERHEMLVTSELLKSMLLDESMSKSKQIESLKKKKKQLTVAEY